MTKSERNILRLLVWKQSIVLGADKIQTKTQVTPFLPLRMMVVASCSGAASQEEELDLKKVMGCMDWNKSRKIVEENVLHSDRNLCYVGTIMLSLNNQSKNRTKLIKKMPWLENAMTQVCHDLKITVHQCSPCNLLRENLHCK